MFEKEGRSEKKSVFERCLWILFVILETSLTSRKCPFEPSFERNSTGAFQFEIKYCGQIKF